MVLVDESLEIKKNRLPVFLFSIGSGKLPELFVCKINKINYFVILNIFVYVILSKAKDLIFSSLKNPDLNKYL